MSNENVCPECRGTDLYSRGGVATNGGYGPDLLPGTSGVFSTGKMRAVVCTDCGLIRFYASAETLKKIGKESGWNPVT